MEIIKNILFALLLVVLSIGVFLGYSVSEKYLKTKAVETCLHTATIAAEDSKELKKTTTITTPENYWYNFCMREKGYK